MTGLDSTVRLPTAVLSLVWDMLDLGEMHPLLSGKRLWVKDGADRRLHAETIEYLTQLGLARDEAPTPHLRSTLQVIAYAEGEYFAHSQFSTGTDRSALVAQRGADAVRVSVQDDVVEIRQIAPNRLATALFDALPQIPGAPVRSVSVASDEAPDPFDESTSAEYLNSVLDQPRQAVHQLYVGRRAGGRHLTGGPIFALDLEAGRVLTYRTTDDRTELIPGDPRAIVKTLNDTSAAL
ncbi:ESX secretion-associated protein EspG [Amycolatopsis sp. La24]|uniref:ESX secretion-associated protein EspG n=1 Tax=Amycolatopsis sp. La24 TaxID=3028304 RepID=UPI0023B04B69|nr:ESX secretion-associated protein EspG [Amycolatopsis sp. La24]